MKSLLTTLILLLGTLSVKSQQTPVRPFVIGEVISLKSEILEEEREINIYLPESYHPDSLRTFPVIYVLDGSRDEDFIHIAGLVQFCSFSWVDIVPESIVVGIGNVDRKRDFTYPSNNKLDQEDFPTSGGSGNFVRFLKEELIPAVEKRYKVSETNTLIGQSLGGLLAAEVLIKQPALFDNYIIVSPSLWWDDGALLQAELTSLINNKSVFIGVGKEGEIMEKVARDLYQKILSKKGTDTEVFFSYFERQDHGDALHLAVYDAFEKIFDPKKRKP